jgi:hypothetical protein
MKRLGNIKETHKAYLRDVRYVLRQFRCKRQRDIRILPLYAATATQRRWLWPIKFAPEGTVASEVFPVFLSLSRQLQG